MDVGKDYRLEGGWYVIKLLGRDTAANNENLKRL